MLAIDSEFKEMVSFLDLETHNFCPNCLDFYYPDTID